MLCSETSLPLPREAVITRHRDLVRGAPALALAVPTSSFWMWGVEEPQVLCEVKWLSHVRLFVPPWTVGHQDPPSMQFSRQEYWSRLPLPSPGDLPNPGIKPGSPTLWADALPTEPQGRFFVAGGISGSRQGMVSGFQDDYNGSVCVHGVELGRAGVGQQPPRGALEHTVVLLWARMPGSGCPHTVSCVCLPGKERPALG